MENDFVFDQELQKFCKERDIWDNEKKRPTKFVINRLKDILVRHPDGYDYTRQVFDGFTTKHPRFKICLYCHKELTGKQRKFCCDKCRDLLPKARKKALGQGGETLIITKEPDGIPKWHKMKVIHRNKKGNIFTKPLTNKRGKTKN